MVLKVWCFTYSQSQRRFLHMSEAYLPDIYMWALQALRAAVSPPQLWLLGNWACGRHPLTSTLLCQPSPHPNLENHIMRQKKEGSFSPHRTYCRRPPQSICKYVRKHVPRGQMRGRGVDFRKHLIDWVYFPDWVTS